jgi:hypothetical protein
MSIQKRSVFFDDTGGYVRFWDWALCTTTLGTMAEPFLPNDRHQFGPFDQFDPTDEIARIDDIRSSSVDKQLLVLSGGSHALTGGTLHPRDGR